MPNGCISPSDLRPLKNDCWSAGHSCMLPADIESSVAFCNSLLALFKTAIPS